MAVNYTPNYDNINGNFKTLKPFRFWCQKVLPLVYDDSLSYYELLNKVVDYLNNTMEDVELLNDNVNTLDENVRNIYDAYNSLQNYVNNYFDNLDVQEEINNKLDAMALDGTLSNLISTIAVPLLPGLVGEWLEENIEPTTPVVDSSLSVSGAAADAKVTGNEISRLKSGLTNTTGNTQMIFEDGYINIVAPESQISLTRITTGTVAKSGYMPCSQGDVFSVNILGKGSSSEGAQAWAWVDSELNVISRSGGNITVNEAIMTAPANAAYFVCNTYFGDKPDSYVFSGVLVKKELDSIQSDLSGVHTDIDTINASARKIEPIDYSVRSADFNWAKKTVDVSTGALFDLDNRVTSQDFVPEFIDSMSAESGYKFMVVVYNNYGETYIGTCSDSDGVNVSKVIHWLTSADFVKIRANRPTGKYLIVFSKEDDSDCDLSIISNLTYSPTSGLEKEVEANAEDIDKIEDIIDGTVADEWVLPEYEKVVATWKNVLIKCEDIDSTNYLRFSNDLGKTFVNIENVWGDVVNTHFFIDGSVLICFPQSCIVVSNDFNTVTPSTIYDYDGSVFVPTGRHFYAYNIPENYVINGVELYTFGDYIVDNITPSRIWYTVDGGITIKCAFKFGTSMIGGNVISVRHVHGVFYNKYNGHHYIATGDTDAQCFIIQGDYNTANDTWTFAIIAQGAEFKLTSWWFDEYYTYFLTDYTTDSEYWQNKGIMRVATTQLGNYSKYQFVYKAPQSEYEEIAPTKLIIDPDGHKIMFPDYKGSNCFWYADYGWNFKKITVPVGTYGQKWLDGMLFGPNYNGDTYICVYDSSSATVQDILKYNRDVINITKMVRENGVPRFYKNTAKL